ncbi:TBC1 domain family member 13 [Seminavis robusta]|uniref:TBC1 domain family member 13 n=1 Tax=Seminavis robusta TaxID=568900 RepID=A0A9N8HEP0_9STRA|nr:TBC1 domain family member 13 [Seminavis robusta]|eukprot:Sro483_g152060.1 TBC1 domain family member 13 (757) ;mRNA; f:31497-33860
MTSLDDNGQDAVAPSEDSAATDSSSAPVVVTPPQKIEEEQPAPASDSVDTATTTATTTTTTNPPEILTNTPKPRNLPPRNATSDSLRSGPLPTIEECLFGIPRDITNKTLEDDEDETAQFYVPLNVLRRVASQGIDDDDEKLGGSQRGLAWRLLLGFLPADRREWQKTSDQQRQSYHAFVQSLFCVEERDINGAELRGHHSKRHRNKYDEEARKKERQERREQRRLSKENNSLDGSSSRHEDSLNPRSPVKFLDESNGGFEKENGDMSSSDNLDDGEDNRGGSETEEKTSDNGNDTEEESPRKALPSTREKLSSSDVLHDDPAQWNMSVREQKILERLTNHDAVNQLLVKRNCKTWNNFLENATLLDEIRKDVNRTHPHLYFYLEPDQRLGARRYGALERILFVWAKLNKGVRYVQGMNEIVGTLYYVLANDFNDEWADHAEADTYILFNKIMSETRDIYVSDLDTADTGIVGRIGNMQNLLKLHDPQVKGHLDDMAIDASFYAVRWLTTLLSREFLLPDTIRLWDSMFASTHKENFLRYVCVTMVLRIREQLLLSDFATCLQLLQRYPSCSMDELLESSRALWIYESQITMACVKGGLTLHQSLQAIPPPEKTIMAFGLRGGVALTNREQLEQASANAKEAVKNNVNRARQGLSTAKQGLLGGARRFLQNRRIKRSKSSGASGSDEGFDNEQDEEEQQQFEEGASDGDTPGMPQRGMFRNLSFGGRAASEGTEPVSTSNGEKAPAIPASVSDDLL